MNGEFELLADAEFSDNMESFELEALRRMDSSDELDFRTHSFSLSSSLKQKTKALLIVLFTSEQKSQSNLNNLLCMNSNSALNELELKPDVSLREH